ncbi:hypothetical protein M405DRAFT_413527 [Rhizopogon salebrosus TDB-379]|nr:hypothetical protein M405DRAFT_413527 [Rhizopogon salebrosus TDB-379]
MISTCSSYGTVYSCPTHHQSQPCNPDTYSQSYHSFLTKLSTNTWKNILRHAMHRVRHDCLKQLSSYQTYHHGHIKSDAMITRWHALTYSRLSAVPRPQCSRQDYTIPYTSYYESKISIFIGSTGVRFPPRTCGVRKSPEMPYVRTTQVVRTKFSIGVSDLD